MHQMLVFDLSNESYCLDITDVNEIIKYTKPSKIPETFDFMEGVINLRGIIIPILNLRKKLSR